MYVPLFIQLMRKSADLSPFRRYVMPALALCGCGFMIYAAFAAYGVTVFCAQESPEAFLAACAPALPEQAREASLRDLQNLEITFRWGCDPGEALKTQKDSFGLSAADFDLAQTVFPGLEAEEALMVSREHRLLTGPAQGVLGAAFGAKKAALSADRVLIVDDVSINLELLAAMLRKFGLRTLTAASGKEALEQLRESDVDLIITDLWMPGMNGAELAAAIHARPELANLKIVALSADTEAAGNFPQQEFFDTLQKPVTMRKLEVLFRKLRETGWP